jgi:hypothetical protein
MSTNSSLTPPRAVFLKQLAAKYGVTSQYDKLLSDYNGARDTALGGTSPIDSSRFEGFGKQLGDLLISGHIIEPDAYHLEADGQRIKDKNLEVQDAAKNALLVCTAVPDISGMELDFITSFSDFLAQEREVTDHFLVGVFASLDTVQ